MALCSLPLLSCILLLQPTLASHDLRWNIAADSSGQATPNILSELDYQGMQSVGAALGLELEYRLSAQSPWSLSVATIYQDAGLSKGRFVDSDYDDDNRTDLISRSRGAVSGSSYRQFSTQFGMHHTFDADTHRLGLLFGFERSELTARMTDGVDVISDSAISGLRSEYAAVWQSGTGAVEYRYLQPTLGELFLRYSYFQGTYRADADWNLRTDFQHPLSFSHQADSTGEAVRLGYRAPVSGAFGWRLAYEWREFGTDPGFDRTFNFDGSVSGTRLNEVRWRSQQLLLGLEWAF
ncbi:MAG: hypothetical protein ACJAWL_000917 [Motiliproteus sp.]|jgi:hypothetical protein